MTSNKDTSSKHKVSKKVSTTRPSQKVIGMLFGGVIIFGAYLINVNNTVPTFEEKDAFYSMLESNLDTSSVRRVFSLESTNTDDRFSVTGESNVGDITNPSIDVELDLESVQDGTGIDLNAQIIFIDRSVFLKYTNLDIEIPEELQSKELNEEILVPKGLIGKWAILVRDGQELGGDSFSLTQIARGLSSLLGEIFIGNYSDDQDKQIMGFIKDKDLYMFEQTDVITEVIGDEQVYKFTIQIDSQKLGELMQIVGPMVGLSEDELANTGSSLGPESQFLVWVTKSNAQLRRVQIVDTETTLTIDYSGFNEPVEITEPQEAKTIKQLEEES